MSIPSTWQQETLGALASQITKGTTPTTVGFQYQTDGIPFVKVENIIDGLISISSVKNFIDKKAHSALKRSQFQAGDVIFSIAGTIGKTALVSESNLPANTNQAIAIIRGISDSFVPRFLNLHLQEAAKRIRVNHARGGAMNNISLSDLKSITVSLPPLAEQKVIADKLDTLLAQVDNTKARLERIPEILKRFRQSVLAAAVSGRLTEKWRELNSSQFPYARRLLAEIILEMRNGLSPKPNENGRGHPILRISSVRPFSVDQVDIRYLEVLERDKQRYSLKPDDLLFTRYNGSIDFVGVCARVKQLDHNTLLYPDKLIRVRVDEKQIIPSFLELFAASYEAREYIYSLVKSTSGQKGISGKDLKLMEVELPSVLEQTEIVHRVGQLFTHADRIEQQVNQALARVNNLTQSILAKAFRGELTEQWRKDNPELISGENSAEALLERIKAERAAKAPAKRTRKKATA